MNLYCARDGDAHGLCALQQLRPVDPRGSILVMGVTRDVRMLQRVPREATDIDRLAASFEAHFRTRR